MKLKHQILWYLSLSITIVTMSTSCKKYLDEKSNKNFTPISTLKDAQAILDYYITMNQTDLNSGEVSTDDYYLTESIYPQMQDTYRRMYLWEKDHLFEPEFNDWSNLYNAVYIANSALEALPKIERTSANGTQWDSVKGQALFFRSWFYLQGLNIWAPAYSQAGASKDLAIPLRLNTNFNEKSERVTLDVAFQQLINDLESASVLLPINQLGLTRPSRAAALALLSRVYLYYGDYTKSALKARESLKLHESLLDFNGLDSTRNYPISPLNTEIIFQSYIYLPRPLNNANASIDNTLISLYEKNDLRKAIFFKKNNDNNYSFHGSYQGNQLLFTGISTNEVLLSLAEAEVRSGNVNEGIKYVDELLDKRWKRDGSTGLSLYKPTIKNNEAEALEFILTERRKELLMRGLRWPDIKRLNKKGNNIALKRVLGDKVYKLEPNSPRFVLPIPEDIINLTGMPQNPR